MVIVQTGRTLPGCGSPGASFPILRHSGQFFSPRGYLQIVKKPTMQSRRGEPPRKTDRVLLDDIDKLLCKEWRLGVLGMTLPTSLDYPIIAIADMHGQRDQLKRLVTRLKTLPEWDDCALVFLGDFVDRREDVPGMIDLVRCLNQRVVS